MEARAAGNDSLFLYSMEQLNRKRPLSPQIALLLAEGYYNNNRPEEGLNILVQYTGYQSDSLWQGDSLWNTLLSPADRLVLNASRRDVTARIQTSQTAFTLDLENELIESMAYEPKSDRWFFGSVNTGRVYQYTAETQELVLFLGGDADGRQGVFSLEIDADRNRLLLLSSYIELFANTNSVKRSTIYEYDLDTGVLLDRNDFYDGDEPRLLNDFERYSDGTLYISDAYYPAILKRSPEKVMDEFVFDPVGLKSTQGLAIDRERGLLYVADYMKGLFIYDLFTGERTDMAFHEAPYTLKGIDGIALYRTKKSGLLYAVQNGSNPARIAAISISKDGRSFEEIEAVDQATFEYGEPTVGVFVDNVFYFIANAPWPYVTNEGGFSSEYLPSAGIEIRSVELIK